jgi:hypothetical protein
MPRATDPQPPTVEQIKAVLIKSGKEHGDEVISVRADQLKQCLIPGCDKDLKKDVIDAGEGFLEVTGNEVLEAIGEANDDAGNGGEAGSGGGGKSTKSPAAGAGGQKRKDVAGGGDSSGDRPD